MSTTEQEVYASLVMDRSGPLGNSLDVFGRRALHTKIGNKPDEPIPTYVITPANAFFAQAEDTTDPGNDKVILSGTLADETFLSRMAVSCRAESKVTLTMDGQFIASMRTGAARPDASFEWEPKRVFPAGTQYEVTIKQRPQSPIQDCAAHLMGITPT